MSGVGSKYALLRMMLGRKRSGILISADDLRLYRKAIILFKVSSLQGDEKVGVNEAWAGTLRT